MDACTVEVGLLRKHPCGNPSVAKCANCEQPLCTKHAIPQHSPTGAKTGKFMCAPCDAAAKQYEQTEPAAAPAAKPAAPAHAAAAAKKPPEAPKPAAAAKPAAAPKPAPAKPEPVVDHNAPLEFAPGKPLAPEKKPAPAPAAKTTPPAPPPAGGKTELSIEHSMPPEPKPGEKK